MTAPRFSGKFSRGIFKTLFRSLNNCGVNFYCGVSKNVFEKVFKWQPSILLEIWKCSDEILISNELPNQWTIKCTRHLYLSKDGFGNFEIRCLKQTPSIDKAFKICFTGHSIICRGGNVIFCLLTIDWCKMFGSPGLKILGTNSTGINASNELCYPMYAKHKDTQCNYIVGQEENRSF